MEHKPVLPCNGLGLAIRAVWFLLGFLLGWMVWGMAHAHGDASWIMEVNPNCCGPNDCTVLPDGAVLRVAQGFLIVATGEIVLTAAAHVSIDEHFWRCQYGQGAAKGKTRCLFAPGLGF